MSPRPINYSAFKAVSVGFGEIHTGPQRVYMSKTVLMISYNSDSDISFVFFFVFDIRDLYKEDLLITQSDLV